jgi:hypothetical protein
MVVSSAASPSSGLKPNESMKNLLLSFGGLVALMISIVVFPPLAAIIVMGGLILLAWAFFSNKPKDSTKGDSHGPETKG